MGVNTPRTNEHKDVAHTISQLSSSQLLALSFVALVLVVVV
jgi:hypothetical protein